MIFELLDAKRKRITQITDLTLVGGSISRKLDDRFVKDVLDAEFSLGLLDDLQNARYIMVSDTGHLRNNPMFRVYQTETSQTVNVTATSYTTEDLGGYEFKGTELTLSGSKTPESVITGLFKKAGYELHLDGVDITGDDYNLLLNQIIDDEIEIGELLKELMRVLDVNGEFTFEVDGDEVAQVGIRLARELGRNVKGALEYGINITNFRIDERVEDIINAVEFTGEEYEDGRLTLEGAGSVTLPKTKRTARVNTYEDSLGNLRHILEDVESTVLYGDYDRDEDKMRPIIEEYSNTGIKTREDLLTEAVRKLDGKSVKKANYTISADVKGIDVGDNVEVIILTEDLDIERYLKVLSVRYPLNNTGRVMVEVGEHIPTELERRFDNISTATVTDKGGDEKGELLYTIIPLQTIHYAEDAPNRRLPTNLRWQKKQSAYMNPNLYDYYVEFDYVIAEQFSGGYFELGIKSNISDIIFASNWDSFGDGYSEWYGIKIAEKNLTSNEGTVSIKLNDYSSFMDFQNIIEIRKRNGVIDGNFLSPVLTVRTEAGNLSTAYYLDYHKARPQTTDDLNELSGYLTNFTVTEHEKNLDGGYGDTVYFSDLVESFEEIKSNFNTVKGEVGKLNSSVSQLGVRMSGLEEKDFKDEGLRNEFREVEKEVERLDKEIEGIKYKLEYTDENGRSRTYIDDLREDVRVLDINLRDVQEEVSRLSESYNDFKREVGESISFLNGFVWENRHSIEDLQRKVEDNTGNEPEPIDYNTVMSVDVYDAGEDYYNERPRVRMVIWLGADKPNNARLGDMWLNEEIMRIYTNGVWKSVGGV